MGAVRPAGTRTSWRTTGDGEFFCPGCGGDRNYRRREGRRRYVLLGVPVLPRGSAGPVLECVVCRGHFAVAADAHPTSTRLAAMLRDAVHAVALGVLSAGGTESAAARNAAVDTIREAGFPDCTEEQLLALLASLGTGGESDSSAGSELHEALSPLGPHLAPAGRESLLLGGARIALADGLYREAERDILAVSGMALGMPATEVDHLLTEAARTPS